MTNKKIIFIFLAAALLVLAVILAASLHLKPRVKPPAAGAPTQAQKTEVDTLAFYDWLVSPGEKTAISALVKLFAEKYPDTVIMQTAIGGGAGYAMTSIIKPLVASSQAPDAFQMHAGYEGLPYYRAGFLDSVDDLWESEKLASVIPSVVQNMNKFDGHYYSVPIDIHRVNLVWYNKDLLFKNGLDASKIRSWEEFFKACDKLKAAGVKYPIQIGEPWTAAHVFEQMAAGEGIDFYQDLINGKVTSANDARLLRVLENLKKYLNYINEDYENLTWDAAVTRLISGESAFNVMGDWADEEFKLAGKKYGTDYGAFLAPETENIYGVCVDTFQRPKNILHPANANRWLKLAVSQEGQDVFNPLKGSIPVRTDADISQYDDYQRSAISDFWKARYIFPSMVHGSGAPQSFKFKLTDIIADFMVDQNVAKAAAAMASYTAVISDEYVINWSLK
jgi:glucose/mannose transport system substrate-binding protein